MVKTVNDVRIVYRFILTARCVPLARLHFLLNVKIIFAFCYLPTSCAARGMRQAKRRQCAGNIFQSRIGKGS